MSTRRRRRYTVTFAELPLPVVVMAYSESGAATTACSYGHNSQTVINVQRGDWRLSLNPAGGWRLNDAALDRARAQLGLRWPVIVTPNAREGDTAGLYRMRHGEVAPNCLSWLWKEPYYHQIMVKSYLTPAEANITLWHELIHARQAEAAGTRRAWDAYQRHQIKHWNYSDRPMEIEAREGASAFGAELSLCDEDHT